MGEQNQTATSEERKLGGSESPPLRTRHSVKPSHPDYDMHFLAYIKAKTIIDPVTGCWLWQGFRNWGGYGQVGYRGENWTAHRAMWRALKGPIPNGLHVCHTCDVRHCVNPDHLWLGTNQQNISDMVAKGRGPCGEKAKKTHCIKGHPLSGTNVRYVNNGRARQCVECMRLYHNTPQRHEYNRRYGRMRRAKERAAKQGAAS